MKWTEEKDRLLLDEIILSEANRCINTVELSELVGETVYAVRLHVMELRKRGLLPPVDSSGAHNPNYISYSDSEKKFIVGAHKAGLRITEIAEQLERPYNGIAYIIGKLISSGEITPRHTMWSEVDNSELLRLVKFDPHNCVANYPELAKQLGIPANRILNHVTNLRKAGKLPPVTGVSIKAIKAFRAGNERVFAKLA